MTAFQRFLKLESAGGILLAAASLLALIVANTPLVSWYDLLLHSKLEISFADYGIDKSLLHWINDFLMAIFFLTIGLEVKREFVSGELSSPSQVVLPAIAAVAGMVVPAMIYAFMNQHDPEALSGWAIPAATDIAFALGVLALLGKRVPTSLKVFLLALAIIDDLGAIIIIALFYTNDLSQTSLILAGICLSILAFMNYKGVTRLTPFMLVGTIMWVCVLKSGVHATLAGVCLGLLIPMEGSKPGHSPAEHLEHELHPWVAFFILPVFAFANAGVTLDSAQLENMFGPVPLGILAGLFIGKPLGVFGSAWITIKLGLARLPSGSNWLQLYGISLLCGVGFTMSMFVGGLAFTDTAYMQADRIGILLGSILSAVVGYLVLDYSARRKEKAQAVSAR
ncbi:Na+/H+ antiporter NhaA [Endozoicomonadaceae bacterium StTr2]